MSKRSLIPLILAALMMLPACGGKVAPSHPNWLDRAPDFSEKYYLTEAVVLSRHNIRSPLSGRGSVLSQITPHEWFAWTSAPAELSRKGGILETQMGQFFAQWMESEGLITRNYIPGGNEIFFYANSKQRTMATAQYFSGGMLPVANVRIRHDCEVDAMDPVFHPQITRDDSAFVATATSQIAAMGGSDGMAGLGQRVSGNIKVLEKVLDAPSHICTDDASVTLPIWDEPAMTGGLKAANSAADALILQYYEEPDLRKAAFGHRISRKDWESVAEIKDWYGDILFTAPSVACNVAHPLLETLLGELRAEGRKFSFLCGHDSNVGSVLAALQNEDYVLPDAIEKKTPIGCKLVFGKYQGKDGKEYADIHLIYASDTQLREMQALSLDNPPACFRIQLKDLKANEDGLYLLPDLESRIQEAIDNYYL